MKLSAAKMRGFFASLMIAIASVSPAQAVGNGGGIEPKAASSEGDSFFCSYLPFLCLRVSGAGNGGGIEPNS